jgi:hypothetical protein
MSRKWLIVVVVIAFLGVGGFFVYDWQKAEHARLASAEQEITEVEREFHAAELYGAMHLPQIFRGHPGEMTAIDDYHAAMTKFRPTVRSKDANIRTINPWFAGSKKEELIGRLWKLDKTIGERQSDLTDMKRKVTEQLSKP